MQQIRKHDEWELNKTKRELDTIKTTAQRERDDRHREKEYKDYAELSQAKRELDEIRRREERELEEKRIKKELELKKLEEERRKKEEDDRRDKAEKEAVERYKLKEAERMAKEKAAKEYAEKEYQRRLQEDLINAGVHEKDIQAIIKKEKIKEKEKEAKKDRPTYTRMARRHLSIETLRVYGIDYELDQVSCCPCAQAVTTLCIANDGPVGSRLRYHQALDSRRGAGRAVEAHTRYSREACQAGSQDRGKGSPPPSPRQARARFRVGAQEGAPTEQVARPAHVLGRCQIKPI